MGRSRSANQRVTQADGDLHSKEIARRLYEARVELGITMQAVADALGRTRQQIEYWESGRARLGLSLLLEWALALGLKLTLVPKELVRFETTLEDPRIDARFLNAFEAADRRTREAIALLLGIDKPLPRSIELGLPVGRPMGPKRVRPLSLSAEQLEELRNSPVPFTGNKVVTALRLANVRIGDIAAAANMTYSRVVTLVRGRAKSIPLARAEIIASCFGCPVSDLFPSALTIPVTLSPAESPVRPAASVTMPALRPAEFVSPVRETDELVTT